MVGAKVKPAAAPAAAMVVWVPMAQPISTSSVPGAKSTATVTPVPGAQACPVTVAGGAAAAGVAPVEQRRRNEQQAGRAPSRASGGGQERGGSSQAPFSPGNERDALRPSGLRHRAVHRRVPVESARSPGTHDVSVTAPGTGTVRPSALRAPPCIPRQRELHHVQRVSGLRRGPEWDDATITVAGQRRYRTGFLVVNLGCARGGHIEESTGRDGPLEHDERPARWPGVRGCSGGAAMSIRSVYSR